MLHSRQSRRFDWMRSSNCSVENVYDPIASFLQPIHKNAHTPIPDTTRQHVTTPPTLAWMLSLLLLLAASQRGAFLVPPANSAYHTMADGSSARYRRRFPNNSYACCSFRGSRLSASSRTTWLWRLWANFNATSPPRRGLVAREHALLAEKARRTELPTDFRLPRSSTPSHQLPSERAQKPLNRLHWR